MSNAFVLVIFFLKNLIFVQSAISPALEFVPVSDRLKVRKSRRIYSVIATETTSLFFKICH